MASKLKPQAQSFYGLPEGIKEIIGNPIIAKRDPAVSDVGYHIGQQWINKTSGNFYALGKVAAGVATWTLLGSVSSTFTTLTSATFVTSTAATSIQLAGKTFTGIGSDANIGFVFTPKGSSGLTLTTGDMTISSGNLVMTSGNATLTSGNLTLTAGALLLTLGNATLTNGNLILGTAGKGFTLKSGANARIGQSTLILGTLAVANTSVTANTRVLMTRTNINASTAMGFLEAVVAAGVGFTITAYDATATPETGDLSTVDWILVESA